ncbi:MAG: DegT/DnrJ/EryC1/StrS family aminotransferase, partial [Bacteroidales bacterium]|nr:DegT/DnrJ/EryC1/StrS family aminotransferase [Bacteroidales bacterium]
INDEQFIKRAEIIWEKGTNRAAFFRGEIDKYGWVDIGSSFLPADIVAVFLYAQLENLEQIQNKRITNWNLYYDNLKILEEKGKIELAKIPSYATNNAHMFYILCKSNNERTDLIKYLKSFEIYPVFHYLSLHLSEFYKEKHDGRNLYNDDRYTDTLLRLPMYFELEESEILFITKKIINFCNN